MDKQSNDQDGSLRKCTVKNAVPDNEHFLPVPSETMTRFERIV